MPLFTLDSVSIAYGHLPLLDSVAFQVDPGEHLTALAADLTRDDRWADAVAGCDYVLHVASPFPPKQPRDPDELIVPAR